MQKITPFLWFDARAEEAACFYVSLFDNSKVASITRYGEAGPGPKGSATTIDFALSRSYPLSPLHREAAGMRAHQSSSSSCLRAPCPFPLCRHRSPSQY